MWVTQLEEDYVNYMEIASYIDEIKNLDKIE